ncbi:MAG: TIGR04282 family arsenosugar biosynthesis glycosyltransferase [Rhodocyclaceae bacterium]|nr:TIGR04282 family arsenosugar biosynthesis glycosyltransferase [Rhodocyclaceae bacterium]
MNLVNTKNTSIAILAKAPVPGYAKTRLVPSLGEAIAARIHRELSLHALRMARAAELGEVSLWCAPDPQQRFFRAIARSSGFAGQVSLHCQVEGNLGQRMAAVFAAAEGFTLLIGTDCPVMSIAHLHQAAQALQDGNDAVFIPAEDGGYALVGLRRALPEIFHDVDWGSERVMTQTRERMKCLGLHWSELETLWDVDRPEDVVRWREGCGNNGISPVGAGDALYGEAVVDH